jgi:predicted phage tail protein
MRNIDGSYSYQGLTTETYDGRTVTVAAPQVRPGNVLDSAFGAPWDKIKGEVEVGQTVRQSTGAATRRVNRPNLDAIAVRLFWPSNNNFGDSSGQGGVRSAHRISVKEGDGPWVVRFTDDFYAIATSQFEREFSISVGQAQYYEVRVERIVADDAAGGNRTSTATWRSYVPIINARLRYPYTAKVALEVNLQRFGATELQRRYHIKGFIIKIPSNATVRADGSLQYSGIWDGTFENAWSSDPAWCLYDLLTKSRYGCGVSAAKLDKFAFYAASTYASELISDGFGNQEPRFSLDVVINERRDAIEAIQRICGMFNAIAFYQGAAILPVVHRRSSVSHLFSNADSAFRYVGTPIRNRGNRVVASYLLPDVPDVREFEPAEDKTAILKYGMLARNIEAFGCTSRGQAARAARWTVYTEQDVTESIIIATGLKGLRVKPGDIVNVGDTDRANVRRWGRTISTSLTSITIDSPINIPGTGFVMSLEMPDGTIAERAISNSGNEVQVILLATPLPILPEPGAAWMISGVDLVPTTWRVATRNEVETYRYEIVATVYDSTKFDRIEQGLNLTEPPKFILPPDPPYEPSNLQLTFNFSPFSIDADWDPPAISTFTAGYQVQYKQIGNLLSSPVSVNVSEYNIPVASAGQYEVQVRAIDNQGNFSGWLIETIEAPLSVSFASSQIPYYASVSALTFSTLIDTYTEYLFGVIAPAEIELDPILVSGVEPADVFVVQLSSIAQPLQLNVATMPIGVTPLQIWIVQN